MRFTPPSITIYSIAFIYCCFWLSSCYGGDTVSGEERKEIDTAREVLRTVESRLVKKIHEKYTKKEEQQRRTWANLKSTLENFVELEKRKLYPNTADNRDASMHISHREYSNVPRIPHREIDTPRIPHREISVPRIPHREIDNPRIPHREVNAPRIPHREIVAQPRVPHDALRVPHRDFERQVPRVPHKDFQYSPRVNRDQDNAPRVPHRDQGKAPRVPHRDFLNSLIKSTSSSDSAYHQLELGDLEKDLLREMASVSAASGVSHKDRESHHREIKKDRELQDRSEECVSACLGIFDTCLHSIESEELFKSCLDLKRSCIGKHSACV